MLAKTYISQTLDTLERLHNKSTSTKKSLFYSKLAILELCGWIEDSMDDIVNRCAIRHLKENSNRDYMLGEVVKKTYGFGYKQHFRNMLMRLIGLVYIEMIERKIDQAKFQRLKATLGALKIYRDREAHTHLKGITQRLDAPSVTKNKFILVYEGLKDYDNQLRRLHL